MGTLSTPLTITLVIFIASCLHSTVAQQTESQGVKCLRDAEGPDEPVNIYYCADAAKPECCEMDEEYTCCETAFSKNKREQLMLWLPLALIFTAVAILCICYRKDTHICEGASLKERCQNCFRKKKPESEPLKEKENDNDFNNIEDGKSRSSTPLSRQPSVFSVKSRQTPEPMDSRPSSAATSVADSQRALSAKK